MPAKRRKSSSGRRGRPSKTTKRDDAAAGDGEEQMTDMVFHQHPLLNAVVVSNIAKHCAFQALSSFRLVCKLWYQLSLKHFREGALVNVALPLMNTCLCQFHGKPCRHTDPSRKTREMLQSLGELTSASESSAGEMMPFQKFRFANLVGSHSLLGSDADTNFFHTLSRTHLGFMTHLELTNIRFVPGNILGFHELLFRDTPNLKSLVMLDVLLMSDRNSPPLYISQGVVKQLQLKSVEGTWDQDGAFSWIDIFSRFPKIQNLVLRLKHVSELQEILTDIRSVNRRNRENISIQDLRLHYVTNCGRQVSRELESLRDLLQHVVLPLESFSAHQGIFEDSDDRDLQHLLRAHKRSLKSLQFYVLLDPESLFEVELVLLEEVEIQRLALHLDATSPLAKPTFVKLFGWMKHVRKLTMDLCNETFRVLCQTCHHLTHLTLIDDCGQGLLDDEGITGMKKNQGRKSLQNTKSKRPPNITNLQFLESFIVVRWNVSFSDKSVYEGFLKLESLKTLKIRNVRLSAQAKADLFRHVPTAQIVSGRIK